MNFSSLILKTTNGGISWAGQDFYINSIHFPNKNVGYAVGWGSGGGGIGDGIIVKTIDAGENWTVQTLDTNVSINTTLFSVHFPDTNTGYIVGANGTILKTGNGGSVGISEVALDNKQVAVSIYPNPNNNEVIVKMNIAKNQNVEIRLLSLSGQVLYEEKPGQLIGSYHTKIDLTQLATFSLKIHRFQ